MTRPAFPVTIARVLRTLLGFCGLCALGSLAGCENKVTDPGASGGSIASGGAPSASGGAIQGGSGGLTASGGAAPQGTGGAAPGAGGKTSAGGAGAGGASSGGSSAAGGSDGVGKTTFVYVGSGSFGTEAGKVTVYRFNRTTQSLEFVSDHAAGGLASFLAVDEARHRLFAVDEAKGGVLSFTIDPVDGKLTSLGATAHTNHPVSLSISPDGGYLLGANYNEGNVDVYPIAESGLAQASSQTIATGSHAHSVRFDSEGRVLVANEGADTISHLTFNAGSLAVSSPATSPSFSARHMTFHPDGTVFVVSERGDFVTAYSRQANASLTELWKKPRLDAGEPTTNTGADIHLTPDGKTLYASNRGQSNSLVMFDVRATEPVLLGHVPSGGTTPRNFAVDPEGEAVMVGNHGDQKTIVLFRVGADGKLTQGEALDVAFSPYFVTFARF